MGVTTAAWYFTRRGPCLPSGGLDQVGCDSRYFRVMVTCLWICRWVAEGTKRPEMEPKAVLYRTVSVVFYVQRGPSDDRGSARAQLTHWSREMGVVALRATHP